MSLKRGTSYACALAATLSACGAEPAREDHHGPEPLGVTRAALQPSDPVSMAVGESCTTASVKGLATQLVEEIQCLKPGTFASIESTGGLELGSAVFPYLQAPAARAVEAAQKDRGTTMVINSALRTLPQQYLLYRWYQTGRCGIGLAASPGKSNHESGLALDIEDNAGWRTVMAAHDMKWLGAGDPVHFDYVGADAVDIGGVSVLAFQRLWNRNHPEDPIDEDSAYGGETEKRLALSPVGGFAKGAQCNEPDAGPPVPDAAPPPDAGITPRAAPSGDDEGCSCRAAGHGTRGPERAAWLAFALACGLSTRRRARGLSRRAGSAQP